MYESGNGPEQRTPKRAKKKVATATSTKRGQRKATKRPRKAKPAFVEKTPADLPCVHRGGHAGTEQCKPCQNSGKKEVAVYHCGLHKFCMMHNFAVKHEGVKPTACVTCDDRTEAVRVKTSDPHESVTACITEFRRPESLNRLQASLAKHLPDIRVEVEPTGGNLSAARNRLAERCRTPYYLMLEEDFEVDGKTDVRKLVRVLESDSAIGGVSTVTREPKRTGTVGRGGRVWWARDFSRVGDWCEHHPSRRAPRTTPDGIDYQPCDLTLCFGVFRTEMMRAVPFDEKIEVGQELVDWFWRVWLDARWGMALVREPMVWHIRDRPGPEYNQPRNRSFRPYVENKLGVTLLGRASRHEHNGIPNVVYLTTGCANSTINVAMAVRAFGFHTGELDERFMEERRLREENRRIWRNSQAAIDRVKVARILRTIPEPWILKEPSWAKTLARWHGVFERYRPHLVFVEKDLAVVRESIRSRGWNAGAYADIARSAQEQFDAWPWGKSRWTAEQIGEAVSLFDPERMAGPIEQEQDPARRALSEAAPNWRQWPEKRVNDWLKSWRHGATNV